MEGLLAEIAAMQQRVEALEKRVTGLEAENAVLRTENAAQRADNTALRKALDEERRAGKRQASPFSRGIRKANPKKPGRKPGGPRSRRSIPKTINLAITVPALLICPHCAVRLGGIAHPVPDGTAADRADDHGIRDPLRVSGCNAAGGCKLVTRNRFGATGAVGGVQIGAHKQILATFIATL